MTTDEILKSKAFDDFLLTLKQEITATTLNDESDLFQEDAFTTVFGRYMVDLQELIEEIEPTPLKKKGFKINGYCLHDELSQIDLFVSSYGHHDIPQTMTKTELQQLIKWGTSFFEKSLKGLYTKLEESSSAFDLAMQIYHLKDELEQVRIYVLTDSLVKSKEEIPSEIIDSIQISYHVWDIERLFQAYSSGLKREVIEIELNNEYYPPIPCLNTAERKDAEYTSYLAIIPGRTLVNIYSTYGPRLLERNVRSFLQAKGKINRKIRDTILNKPQRFLAYNNGISATAENIEIKVIEGQPHITWIRDLQIVNGGQTTASLYQAYIKNRNTIKLEEIFIQAKVTVIKDSKRMDEIVPSISKYANSQNKVSMADLTSNHPFHRDLEELSRTMWAPAVKGSQQQTRWFYERARGQFNDERNRAGSTQTAQKNFDLMNPKSQKFEKTDMAKYEHSWMQLPHEVSRGAQKNFNTFMLAVNEQKNIKLNDDYFVELIARAILFKTVDKIVAKQQREGVLGQGYKANVTTYTIAWLSHHLMMRLNFLKIWQNQALSDGLKMSIENITKEIYKHITDTPGAQNVTEWCKKKVCWDKLLERNIQPRLLLEEDDASTHEKSQRNKNKKGLLIENELSESDQELINSIANESPDYWFELASWASETDNLQVWQRKIAFSVGRLLNRGNKPSIKQARQADKMKKQAESLGFKPGQVALK